MATKQLFWAARPFGYAGKQLDRGMVFELVGSRNDEKLIGMAYIQPVAAKAQLVECPGCGAQFVGHDTKAGHYEKRHIEHNAREEDSMADREERMLDQIAPLNLQAA